MTEQIQRSGSIDESSPQSTVHLDDQGSESGDSHVQLRCASLPPICTGSASPLPFQAHMMDTLVEKVPREAEASVEWRGGRTKAAALRWETTAAGMSTRRTLLGVRAPLGELFD